MLQKPNYRQPLPNCEGPKLALFKDSGAAIDFRRLLSDKNPDAGGHAHVFEVSIRSRIYALKVFKFYDDAEDTGNLTEEDKKNVTINLVHAHMDPFYNECRAYGKLVEADKNGKIAVRCHGYLTLPAAVEDELEEKFDVSIWDRPNDEYDKPASKREPLRAIVKDLVREDTNFTEKDVKRMLRHLRNLGNLGVYTMDVRARNYRAGLLVDFSVAITEPHYLLQTRPQWQVSTYKRQDLLLFDKMIAHANLDVWDRATPNPEYMKKLRQRPKRKKSFIW